MNNGPCKDIKLSVKLGSLTLWNPMMNASGTAGYGTENPEYFPSHRLGAFVTKGLSCSPRSGNPPPRIVETPAGMLNAVGLENIGIDMFARMHLPDLRRRGVRLIVNFFGESEEGYIEAARRLSELEGVAGLEANVSCPNIRRGGRVFGKDPEVLCRLITSLRGVTELPLIVKLTPDAADILEVAQACWEAGCDGLTVANTYKAMAIDVIKKTPRISIGSGGLSGPAIRPLTLFRVWQVARSSPVPVIGVGGIVTAQDAIEYLIAGASAVQVGSGLFNNPKAPMEILEGIEQYLVEQDHASVGEIIGSIRDMPDPF
jgi:dihydroorotate dehydrogenase (NAD+) catalytic subunit